MYRAIKNIPMVRSFHGYNQEKKYQRQVDSPADEQELSAELNFQAPIQQQFSPGDHVYQWRCIGLAQKHAIVTTAKDDLLIITDFYPNRIAGSKKKSAPRLLLKEIEQKEWSSWKKVQYDAGFLARNIHRSGTCTSVPSDFSRMILARVRFLLDHDCNQDDSAALPSIIPSYHVLKSNSECVAVWCTTGRWTTLQASSFLHTTIAGQAKSTATVALYAANQTVTGKLFETLQLVMDILFDHSACRIHLKRYPYLHFEQDFR